MKSRSLVFLPLALPLLAATLPAHLDTIQFQPREGLVLTKTFSMTTEVESSMSSERSSSTSTSSSERSLVVTDRVVAHEDERVTKLERTFDEISVETESAHDFGGQTSDFTSSADSELSDETVVFVWDEDEEEYVVESEDADDDLLVDLKYDYDFVALLPGDDVDEGDEWEIELEDFEAMMNPWDGVPLEWERSDGEVVEASADSEGVEPEIDESKDGEITARYAGTREVDGVTYAVIEIEGEIDTERTVDFSREDDRTSSTSHQETSETRTIEGVALWQVEGGHLHSLEIEFELSGSETMESTFRFGDREFNNESETDVSGTTTLTVVFALEDEDE